jgi:hypothetical protein
MKSKSLLAALSLLLLGACSLANSDVPPATSSDTVRSTAEIANTEGSKPRSHDGGIPSQIRFASAVGDVVFQHEVHFKDRGIPCVQCHHQINAKTLTTPHPDYLKASAVNCQVCHKESERTVYSCTECHDKKRRDIADETLSAKVVIHKQCQTCHSVGTGKDASSACLLCHSPAKNVN